MIKKRKTPRIFPGWWMVLAGTWMNFWGTAYTPHGFSALFKPISSELGFSRASTSVVSGISRLEGGILSPLVGWLVDKFGPRWTTVFGVFLFSLALASMYFVNSLWTFYLVWGLMLGTGVNFYASIPAQKAITNWFVKKRGLASGIRLVFSGVLILPFITWLINTYGWRETCLLGGIVAAAVSLPLAAIFIRNERPEHYGLLPDGATAREEVKDKDSMISRGVKYAAEVEEIEFTLRQSIRTPAFWLLLIAQGGYMMAHESLTVHVIPFLTDIGIDATKAATMVAVSGFAGVLARMAGGIVADRLRKGQLRILLSSGFLLQGIGMVFISFKSVPSTVYLFLLLILTYAGYGISIVLIPLIGGRYFGRKAFGSIRGFSQTFTVPMVILGPVYTGWVYDTSGSYLTAFATLAAVFGVSTVLMFCAKPPKPPADVSGVHEFV